MVESSGTDGASPGAENVAADPLAATALVQLEFVYSLTVDPPSAVPLTSGELAFAGDAGSTASQLGVSGGVESST